MRTGASLVPVLSFGENELFQRIADESGLVHWMSLLSKKVRRTVPGRRCCGAPVAGEAALHPAQPSSRPPPPPTHPHAQLFGFTLPLARGVAIVGALPGILPRRRPLNIVVGAPIPVRRFDGGDCHCAEGRALVDEYHGQYVAALHALWETHRGRFAPGRRSELRIVE
jgi:2-acylglycerol O-acyltransferase 2